MEVVAKELTRVSEELEWKNENGYDKKKRSFLWIRTNGNTSFLQIRIKNWDWEEANPEKRAALDKDMQPRMSMKYQRKIDTVRMDGWIKTI